MRTQVRQVLRRLARAPMFTAVTLITLAAGVGANTVVFSVLEGILLKPLPYPKSQQLVVVNHAAPGIDVKELPNSPSTYFVYRDQNRSFQDIALISGDSVSVTGVAEPEQVRAEDVTDGLLPVLGVAPAIGRGFTRQDDSPGNPKTTILMYGYWQRKFGGNRAILGQTIKIDGEQHQVIGVMPQSFHFFGQTEDPALLLPFQFDRNKTFLGNFSYQGVARLKPGVTIQQASSDVARMIPIVLHTFQGPPGFSITLFEDARLSPNIKELKQSVVGDIGNVLWVLMGSIGLVLLIACANVANLVLVRVEGRRQELAIRSALGARWSRIAAELLVESVVLGVLGSLLGLALAYGGLRVLLAVAPKGLPRLNEIGIDANVLLFTLGVALLASVLFGCIPIFKYAGARLATGLREGARGMSQSREQHRARSSLVVVQVALALVLLICSGLMMRTFVALTKVDPGFTAPAEIQTFSLSIPETEIKDKEIVPRTFEAVMQKLAALPGVSSVGLSTGVPLDNRNTFDPVYAEDHTYRPGQLAPIRRFKFISPGLLATMGTPLVAGRDFTWTDIYQKLPVAMVSENLARELWQSPANALGKRVRVGSTDDWRQIVGVVSNVYYDGMNKEAAKTAYWPILMANFEGDKIRAARNLSFVLRTPRAGTESLMQDVRAAVWSVDPNLPVADVRTEDYYYRASLARTTFTLLMLGIAAAMALLLGTVGIYGVIAYSVSQRTREIGIRMALGAQRNELTGLFVRHGLLLTGVGVVIGLAAAFASMRLLASLLYKVSPMDLLTYTIVSGGLILTAFLASYLPSRRAAGVDPVEALRSE
ncbi:MAG TPA: ABC transporter permease [Candidatus Acidoferrales bacterium]|nr:ABC transporter permease [Candidatus Acidoferrales bacterium]